MKNLFFPVYVTYHIVSHVPNVLITENTIIYKIINISTK